MSKVHFEHLFAPLQVGPMRVPNRICETTNTINSSMSPGLIDDHFIAHHGAKARESAAFFSGRGHRQIDAPLTGGAGIEELLIEGRLRDQDGGETPLVVACGPKRSGGRKRSVPPSLSGATIW